MSSPETVTIGVPVYHGEGFVAETLRTIQEQTYQDFQVIIALDGPQPASEAACQPFLNDPRFRLVVQPTRLGWVDNLNWIMAQVDTPFWCYQAHDDLIAPHYLATLIHTARQAPEAAIVYSDLVTFGWRTFKLVQPSVTGNAAARQLALLGWHHPSGAFRGLTRLEALRHAGGVRHNTMEDFSVDTTWMAAAARWGELRRVPLEMYYKRYHDQNEHVKWANWSPEIRQRAWGIHCADMLDEAMQVEATIHERRLLWLTAVIRLVSPHTTFGYVAATTLTSIERDGMLAGFLEEVGAVRGKDVAGWLEDSRASIQQWTWDFYRLPTDAQRVQGMDALKQITLRFWRKWRYRPFRTWGR
jgi:hypothetical protein